jgi:hypothetical protein
VEEGEEEGAIPMTSSRASRCQPTGSGACGSMQAGLGWRAGVKACMHVFSMRHRPADLVAPLSLPTHTRTHRWVIGKEGSFIKQLEEKSRVGVRISDSACREFGRQWKYVQVQGTPRAVDRAKSEYSIYVEGRGQNGGG